MKKYVLALAMVLCLALTAESVPYMREAGVKQVIVNGVCRAWKYHDSHGAITRIDVYHDAEIADYGDVGTVGSIAWAVAQIPTATGGDVHVMPGTYAFETGVTLKSGIWIRGSQPIAGTSGIADLLLNLSGGTLFTGPGITIFSGNNIYGGGIENIGFDDIGTAISSGATNEFGPQFFTIRNVFVRNFDTTGVYLSNFGQCTVDNLTIYKNDHNAESTIYGLHLVSDNDSIGLNFQPGNSVFKQVYVYISKSEATARTINGIYIQAKNPYYDSAYHQGMNLNYLTFIRPQVNMFEFSGTLAGSNRKNFAVEGAYNDPYYVYCYGHRYDGLDLEGHNEYHFYSRYTQNQYLSVSGGNDDSAYSVYSYYFDTYNLQAFADIPASFTVYADPANTNRVRRSTDIGAWAAVPKEFSTTLPAVSFLSTYGPNTLITSSATSPATYTLPECRNKLPGKSYIIKKIKSSQPITINGHEVISQLSDVVLDYNAGDSYVIMYPSGGGGGAGDVWVDMVAYVTRGTGETHVTEGWYHITVSHEWGINLGQDITDDAGLSAPYVVNVKITESIVKDSDYYGTWNEIDAIGDWAHLMCDGGSGWQILGRYIAP